MIKPRPSEHPQPSPDSKKAEQNSKLNQNLEVTADNTRNFMSRLYETIKDQVEVTKVHDLNALIIADEMVDTIMTLKVLNLSDKEKVEELRRVFKKTAKAASEKYEGIYKPDLEPDVAEGIIKQANGELGGVALDNLPAILKAAEIKMSEKEINELIEKATFNQILEQIKTEVGAANIDTDLLDANTIKLVLNFIVDEDWKKDVESISLRDSETQPLTKAEKQVLDLAIRTAHVAWKAAQIHRARVEGDNKRIDSHQSNNFKPIDLLKRDMYIQQQEIAKDAGENADKALGKLMTEKNLSPQQVALISTAFEIYKDLGELKKALAAKTEKA